MIPCVFNQCSGAPVSIRPSRHGSNTTISCKYWRIPLVSKGMGDPAGQYAEGSYSAIQFLFSGQSRQFVSLSPSALTSSTCIQGTVQFIHLDPT